ncbi:MAG: hypothetical protein QXU32_05265 [Nitrososphaerales archaeon]
MYSETKNKRKCEFCDDYRRILFYVYDNVANSDHLVCALHLNKLYFDELSDQLMKNREFEEK